jgi:hypothetical protein
LLRNPLSGSGALASDHEAPRPLGNYFLSRDLARGIGTFVDHNNNHRHDESLDNLTPANIYHDRGAKILKMREEIKKQTIRRRRLQHQSTAA